MYVNTYEKLFAYRLLEVLSQHCPGMGEGHLLLAEAHHLAGATATALRKAADVLHHAPDNTAAQLLLTRIYIHQVNGCSCML